MQVRKQLYNELFYISQKVTITYYIFMQIRKQEININFYNSQKAYTLYFLIWSQETII